MGIQLQEHITCKLSLTEDWEIFSSNPQRFIFQHARTPLNIQPRNFKIEGNKKYPCFKLSQHENELVLKSNYFVGVDWLTQERFIYVEPKMNFESTQNFERILNADEDEEDFKNTFSTKKEPNSKDKKFVELNLIEMLLKITSQSFSEKETKNLLLIDWEMPMINIAQNKDLLTPFLVIRFLNVLKQIVRKGLKSSYYNVQENLRNRVKGKILITSQIRQNILKNKLSNTICEYQVYGVDHLENRFLKKVFEFCAKYIQDYPIYFTKNISEITSLLNFIKPAFQSISNDIQLDELKNFKHNPFYKEYKEATKLGSMILKRFSYHLTKQESNEKIPTPPYWIDMPKLFELYVYALFLEYNPEINPEKFNFQFSTHGNSLDFLINHENLKMVVDAKYKLKYNYGKIHEDIRQVAGYARLNKVRAKLKICQDETIPCLIIYPTLEDTSHSLNLENLNTLLKEKENQVNGYYKVYKIGIKLPYL